MPQQLDLQINKLVLHGFSADDAPHIKAAIEQELSRLFSEQGVPSSLLVSGAVGHLNAGRYDATPGATPDAIGGQIAQTIYAGFTK